VQSWAECEISFGHLVDGVWQVERSTMPECEGVALPLLMTRLDVHSAEVHVGNQHSAWSVLEWSDAP
jgi:hypothetical protein